MSIQPGLQHYVDRYHEIQDRQLNTNKLIEVPALVQPCLPTKVGVQSELKLTPTQQDVLIYANDIEVNLRNENTNLAGRLQDAELDLDDARRSRRELQQQLKEANQRMAQFNMDNENLKVNAAAGVYSGRKLTWTES